MRVVAEARQITEAVSNSDPTGSELREWLRQAHQSEFEHILSQLNVCCPDSCILLSSAHQHKSYMDADLHVGPNGGKLF